jgi:hypothetical protein
LLALQWRYNGAERKIETAMSVNRCGWSSVVAQTG